MSPRSDWPDSVKYRCNDRASSLADSRLTRPAASELGDLSTHVRLIEPKQLGQVAGLDAGRTADFEDRMHPEAPGRCYRVWGHEIQVREPACEKHLSTPRPEVPQRIAGPCCITATQVVVIRNPCWLRSTTSRVDDTSAVERACRRSSPDLSPLQVARPRPVSSPPPAYGSRRSCRSPCSRARRLRRRARLGSNRIARTGPSCPCS